MTGLSSDGRPVAATVTVEKDAAGVLHVTRAAKKARGGAVDEAMSWTADATAPSANVIEVRFEHTVATPGVVGRLAGSRGGATEVVVATYTLTYDGLRLTESLTRTGGPQDGWTKITGKGARSLDGLSYGEIAALAVPRAFDEVVRLLPVLGPDTKPSDVQALRYAVAETRDLVDVFAFAYPKDGDADEWKKIRDDLDEGYEALGHFKDLWDTQGLADPSKAVYDAKKVKALRGAVLEWAKGFRKPKRLAESRDYLASPKKKKLTARGKGELSSNFWGGSGVEPDEKLSGLENVARLERALFENANELMDETADLRRLHKDDVHEAFHDFRKRLRAATKVAGYLPQLFEAGDPKDHLPLLVQAADKYGDVNDKIIAYELARERGDEDRADALVDEIAKSWKSVRSWQRDVGLSDVLKERSHALVEDPRER